MVLSGFHSVTARLRQAPQTMRELFLDRDRVDARARELMRLAESCGVEVRVVPAARLDRMCRGQRHQGVVAMVDVEVPARGLAGLLEELARQRVDPLLLLLDGVTDPRNLGACLRVADGAGAHAVVAPKDHSCGLTDAAVHTSSGAAEHVPFISVTNLARTIEDLQLAGLRVVGTADDSGQSLYDAPLDGPLAWVLGSEDKGIRRLVREQCDALVSIPMLGACESLNVSVAAGVVLYETVRRRIARQP
ncbi:MAG: 23S rRNA (guanosine(2251)-2'-O)-methyltransferase RlmB [Lautropia sp.]